MADFGTDLLLDEHGRDLLIDATDEPRQVDAAMLVRQDLAEALRTPLGSLPWDTEAGSTLLEMLNAPVIDPGAVEAEIRRVAFRDPRIDAASVQVSAPLSPGEPWSVTFQTFPAADAQTLEFPA